MTDYEMVIGLEVHVELVTESKFLCSCSTKFGSQANTHCCPICVGMPGALPSLNKKVVEYAIAAGLALNCKINQECHFDRKNYFYPDLPKAYQVSQLYAPLCYDGSLEIDLENGKKTIGIHEIHMEEDAGKLIHDPEEDITLVDYNRSGVPLIEIVTEADFRSGEEVTAFLEKLRLILQYLGVSDCKMQEGSLRVDVNLSVRKFGDKELGTRTEMKNLNSFKAIGRAVEWEKNRQIQVLESGEKVIQETRRWDDINEVGTSMRTKEEAQDYRYFPDPDLPPLKISREWIDEIHSRQPELREDKMNRYIDQYDLPAYDAEIITSSKYLADIFEKTTEICQNPKEVSNWVIVETMRLVRQEAMDVDEINYSPENLARLIMILDKGKINRTVAKEVFERIFIEDVNPEDYIEANGLYIVSDDKQLRETIERVLEENPKPVEQYRNGEKKVMGFLIGQSMKALKGKGDASKISEILKEILD